MKPILLAVVSTLLVFVVCTFGFVRYYNRTLDILSGRLIEAEHSRLAQEQALRLTQQQAEQAIQRADSVRMAEEAKRGPLEDQNRILVAENAALKKSQANREQEQAAQLETIPTLKNSELADKTVEALKSAYPRVNAEISAISANNISAFQANRPAVELSLTAAWEALASRQSLSNYKAQITNCETRSANLKAIADSFHGELTAERSATSALRLEIDNWQDVYQASLHEIELWKAKDKARSRKGFWDRFIPRIGAGACATVVDGRVGVGPCLAAIYPIN